MNLQNLVDWADYKGIDLFSGVTVPEPLNAETVKSAIMIRSGLMTPLYLEPEVFQACIKHWFTSKQWTFAHLINIIQAEYSPIENYNRYEESTESGSGYDNTTTNGVYADDKSVNDTLTMSGGQRRTNSGTDTERNTGTDTEAHSGTDVTTNEISAENVSTYSPDSQTSVQHGESIGTTHGHQVENVHGHIVTDEFQNRTDETERTERIDHTMEQYEGRDHNNTNTRTSNIHGNIGVTTNQQMIEQELELLRHFDIYRWIAEQFEDDNMLLIY